MPPVFPVPTLDHVVVNARDRLDDAADTYRRLGFTLTPRGCHTLGSINHLAMFGTDYLELIASRPGDDSRPEITAAPFGLNGLVFGTEDATATYEALRRNGVPIDPPRQFSRPVEFTRLETLRATRTGGELTAEIEPLMATRDALFRTTGLPLAGTPAGRF